MTEVLCGATVESCRCVEEAAHEGPHVCDCRGSWMYDTLGRLVPVVFPGGREVSLAGMVDALDDILERWESA